MSGVAKGTPQKESGAARLVGLVSGKSGSEMMPMLDQAWQQILDSAACQQILDSARPGHQFGLPTFQADTPGRGCQRQNEIGQHRRSARNMT
jgi:hypothetical protein